MREPTQKKMAIFYGVTENTLTNWKKQRINTNRKTGESCKWYPPTGRHKIFEACKFYLMISEKTKLYKEVLEQIYDSIEMLENNKSFVVEGEKINFKDLAKKNLENSKEKIKELSEILSHAI